MEFTLECPESVSTVPLPPGSEVYAAISIKPNNGCLEVGFGVVVVSKSLTTQQTISLLYSADNTKYSLKWGHSLKITFTSLLDGGGASTLTLILVMVVALLTCPF